MQAGAVWVRVAAVVLAGVGSVGVAVRQLAVAAAALVAAGQLQVAG